MNKAAEITGLIAKAHESIEVGRQVLHGGHYGFAAARFYYAMFYAAQAALLHKDLQFSKHSAVIARFNKEFVKPGVLRPEAFKSFRNGFELRAQGDYGLEPVSAEEAKNVCSQAETFLQALQEYLIGEGYQL